ncbi:unnamed protein product [Lepidochelys kempii]
MPSILGLLLTWLGAMGWERPLLRSRRSWVWNQFLVIEEYAGPEPVLIGRLHSDVDRGKGRIKYVLTGEGAGTVFVIDERTGNVLVTKTLDRGKGPIHAPGPGRGPGLKPAPGAALRVHHQSAGHQRPPARLPARPLPCHCARDEQRTSVIQVTAQDAHDPSYGNGSKLVHMVLEGLPFFSVDPQTGVVRTAIPNMDREAQAELLVVIQAKDLGGHAGGLLGSVTVTLSDVNDPSYPRVLTSSRCWRRCCLAPPWGGSGPTIRTRGNARLLDGDGPFAISTDPLGPGPPGRPPHPQPGFPQPLDFEQRPAYTLGVEAANTQVDPLYIHQGPFKDVATVHVAMEDAAEPPAFARPSYQLGVPEDSPPWHRGGEDHSLQPGHAQQRHLILHPAPLRPRAVFQHQPPGRDPPHGPAPRQGDAGLAQPNSGGH